MTSVALPENKAWLSIARSPERLAIGLILAFSVYRLVLAATLGLGVDEAYGIGVSHDLDLSYFDHPPLNYWIAHAFIPLLGDGRELRLPFIALFAATNWTLYLLTRHLFDAAAGVWAVLALNLSMFFAAAGGWILPDGPLMLSLVAAGYWLARGLFPGEILRSPWLTWCGTGFWIGLAGLSKYHALLFVGGLLLYLFSTPGRGREYCCIQPRGLAPLLQWPWSPGARLECRASLGFFPLPRWARGPLRRLSENWAISRQPRWTAPLDGPMGVRSDDRGHVLCPAIGKDL